MSSPGERARAVLAWEWDEPDSLIAKLAGCSKTTAQRARHQLEQDGEIPVRQPDLSEDAWRSDSWRRGPTWHARRPDGLTPAQRARMELESDPWASNNRLAERARCSRDTVIEARRYLEATGLIEVIKASERDRRIAAGIGMQRDQWPELPAQPASMRAGLCVVGGHDPALWHPARNDQATRGLAISICRQCPALEDCRTWAMSLPVRDGAVYGGLSGRQRRAQQHRAAQAAGS